MSLNLRRYARPALGVLVLLAAVAVLLLSGGPSYGSDKPVKRGDICSKIGEERQDRSGDVYVCQQKADDLCPRFHAKHPGGGGSKLPPCVCPGKSPSASPTPSVSPSAAPSKSSPAASPSTSPSKASAAVSPQPSLAPAGNSTPILPITGDSTTGYLLGASALLIGGGLLLLVGASWRRRCSA